MIEAAIQNRLVVTKAAAVKAWHAPRTQDAITAFDVLTVEVRVLCDVLGLNYPCFDLWKGDWE